ncbi:FAD-binding and (Fe-S)-binding domain-containing protein [Natronobacterium gregoryi]|uniref:D-lactate dehydrogenase (cytochrome) n=2 Tax=Natronobacterium gregoryi TaxID=44930 RepID=L0ALL1_NATGS|nr:FAD-binding and (Fe-S)-binding domain-containing protein [Natronobacterium gregoryi]AFZ74661.1 FAD/FMN-dependent dehydrogenase [Natronobacterium gregoryi SP2]ELY72523.1 D-lactate dehydrogenase (cytochrome) [Natronobacterium gregoryi SP2]PLK18165.1 FAD-binding oxidoreductase [Natronobacterium gregoryi SP2]SFJ31593.1 FAD/FMN-containing dehydrogenase [Natronobacterium gregoryi]
MTTTPPTRGDPADDPNANYDYQSDDVERPDLVADLERRVTGDVRFDSYSRQLYATDASIYEVTPIGVVFPKTTADVARVVGYCADEGIPVLPRGGGTSLAGQTVNEAVVLDFTKYMDGVVEIDPHERLATAQSGIYLESLNENLEPHDLKFAPDPAWGDKSALGGAIGNNSTGAHSLQYGKTDAYVEEVEVVLADGTVTTFGEVAVDDLSDLADGDDLEAAIYGEVARILEEKGDLVEEVYPDLKRNVSGYNLDWLVEGARGDERGIGEPDAEGGTVNLAKLLCGSEGTLAIVTEATVSLESLPEEKSMALLAYDTVLDAMDDVEPIVEHDPAAVEVLDDVMIDLARETPEFASVAEMLPEGTAAVLIVEFYADDIADGKRKVANLLADRCPAVDPEGEADDEDDDARTITDADALAFDALEAYDADSRAKIWKLRKSGLPILLSRTTDEKHVAFIEDTGIPPENLREFVADFQDVLEDHETYASFYAHAGPGVLHIRPLVNTKTQGGLEAMESIAADVTDLVVEYDGSVSGEHGDGRARTQWNRKLYGDEMWETFQELKTAFDPDWLLNPGQVVFREENPTDMTENHRFGPDYEFDAGFESNLEWREDNGFQGMVELCHGCGGCRGEQSTTGGVMCPTFRAEDEEILSTRGRANALRQAMNGELDADEQFSDEFVEEVLDLCIGCKGCKHDCPSGVDLAKLKAELTYEHHKRHGTSIRDRMFANFETLAKLGSATAPLSNWATKVPGSSLVAEKVLGISRERDLPTFRRNTFTKRVADHRPAVSPTEADHKVVLVPDIYTNHEYPEAGEAALEVLEAAGVHVEIADPRDVGRPAYSKGMLDEAAENANDTVHALLPYVEDGYEVVLIEPSDAVMVQSDYLDLFDHDEVRTVAENAYGICEYLDRFNLDRELAFAAPDDHLAYHGHCHQKAHAKDHHAVGILRRAGYAVDPLDSTCCGMAGSFGYEAEHYSMSMAIADVLYDQVDESEGDHVVAPGASCRTQLEDRPGATEEPPTPIEVVAEALADAP